MGTWITQTTVDGLDELLAVLTDPEACTRAGIKGAAEDVDALHTSPRAASPSLAHMSQGLTPSQLSRPLIPRLTDGSVSYRFEQGPRRTAAVAAAVAAVLAVGSGVS